MSFSTSGIIFVSTANGARTQDSVPVQQTVVTLEVEVISTMRTTEALLLRAGRTYQRLAKPKNADMRRVVVVIPCLSRAASSTALEQASWQGDLTGKLPPATAGGASLATRKKPLNGYLNKVKSLLGYSSCQQLPSSRFCWMLETIYSSLLVAKYESSSRSQSFSGNQNHGVWITWESLVHSS